MKKLFLFFAAIISTLILIHIPGLFPLVIFGALLYVSIGKNKKKFFDFDDWINDHPSKKQNIIDIKISKPKKSSFKPPLMNNQLPSGTIILGILAFIGFSILSDGIVNVPAGQVAVVFDRGQGVLDKTMQPGIHLKIPFWQTATTIETRVQETTISTADRGEEPIEALTKDGQQVYIDTTIQYFISSENAPKLYAEVGLDYKDKIITPGVRSIVREVITGYDSTELFAEEARTQATQKARERLTTNYAAGYITLKDILIRNVRFSDTYLNAIEEKKVAEQKIQKADFEKQEAEIRKEKTIIEAQAEAEAIKLKGEALSQNPEVIQLQFVDKLAPNVNWGILPDGALPLINPSDLQRQE